VKRDINLCYLIYSTCTVYEDIPVQVLKTWEGGGKVSAKLPHTPNLGSRWRLMVSFTPRSIYSREITPLPTEEEAGCSVRDDLDGFGKENVSCSSQNIKYVRNEAIDMVRSFCWFLLKKLIFVHIY
jgi:hypothetical protein